jgi:hypothetical protein
MPLPAAGSAPRSEDAAFQDRGLDVYRAYDLAGTPSIGPRQTTRVALAPVARTTPERKLVFDGDRLGAGDRPAAAQSELRLVNDAGAGLGRHLPAGRVRIQTMEGGALRFLGEDAIPHTAPGEAIRLVVGASTTVTGERRTTAVDRSAGDRTTETRVVTLRNAGAGPEVVDVVEHPGGDWVILSASVPAQRVSVDELRFTATVPAGGEVAVEWTIQHTIAPPRPVEPAVAPAAPAAAPIPDVAVDSGANPL